MKLQKKHLVAGAIGLVTITGAIAYLQLKKALDYAISFKNIKFKKINNKEIDFDLFLTYTNKASLQFDIVSQKYDIYLNNIFVTTLTNNSSTHIPAKETTILGLNVLFNPTDALKKINKSFASVVSSPDNIMIKMDCYLKLKIWMLPLTIHYVYEDTLKNMMG